MINYYHNKKVKKFVNEVKNPSFDDTGIAINSRTIINGGTGTGKTNILMDYIIKAKDTFNHIVICNKDVDEPLYETLRDQLSPKGAISFFTLETMPTVQELRKNMENEDDEYLVVFDDLIADLSNKKLRSKLLDYFIIGRKLHVTVFFLTQSWHKVPKNFRLQVNYLMMLKAGSQRDLNLILSDFELGVDRKQLRSMYQKATAMPMNCFKIDVNCTEPSEKFTRNFKDPFHVEMVETPDGDELAVVTPGSWYKEKQSSTSNTRKRKAVELEEESV